MQGITTCGLCGERVPGKVGYYGNGFAAHPACIATMPREPINPAIAERERQLLQLRAKSPLRGRTDQADLVGLPMFDGGLGL